MKIEDLKIGSFWPLRRRARAAGRASARSAGAETDPEAARARREARERWQRWEERSALRQTVDGTPELRALYARLGYLPEVEREAERILGELKALIRAEIPDFAAFEAALADIADIADIETQLAADSPADIPEDRPRFLPENEALLRAVRAARGDRAEILRLLNEDPVDHLLPVVEQIPMVRNGEVIWRTPMELTLIRKRPARPDRFERLLDELDGLVRGARLRRRPTAREAVLAAISRVRRDAGRENAYLPTPLQALAAEVDGWLHRSLEPSVRRRREELDGLLRGLLRVRHALEGESAGDLRETARGQAQAYAGQPWMHTPWLTSFALANLLDTELALFAAGAQKGAELAENGPAQVLRVVRDEVASRHYDSDETIRRLRQQEERGLFVHSLIYALLRMNRLPGAAAAPEGDAGAREQISS